MLMVAFGNGLLKLGPWGTSMSGIRTAQFDLSAVCERPVQAKRQAAKPP